MSEAIWDEFESQRRTSMRDASAPRQSSMLPKICAPIERRTAMRFDFLLPRTLRRSRACGSEMRIACEGDFCCVGHLASPLEGLCGVVSGRQSGPKGGKSSDRCGESQWSPWPRKGSARGRGLVRARAGRAPSGEACLERPAHRDVGGRAAETRASGRRLPRWKATRHGSKRPETGWDYPVASFAMWTRGPTVHSNV